MGMCIVPRCTSICSTVFASKSECSACHTMSVIRPASWTASAAQISIRAFLRRDMPLPPYDHPTGLCYLASHQGRGGDRMDFEVTYTDEQQRFRREVRAW